jgi:2,3-diketo-5-methylthiopentyl-1-phosphate enolase
MWGSAVSAVDDRMIQVSEGLDPDAYIVATYLLQGPLEDDMLARALSVATEQTVGRTVFQMPELAHLVQRHGGRVLNLFSVPDHESKTTAAAETWQRYIVRVAFPAENCGFQIPMLLTMLIGDISMGGMIKLVDLDLPSRFLKAFQGPKYGLPGIRTRLATDRPLICSILKPCVGVGPKEAGEIFYQHAVGGADVIKDDELMSYSGDLKVEDRVRACMAAARRAAEETGEPTLYLASVTDRPDRVLENARRAVEAGANGLMLTPLSTGIATLQMLAEDPEIQAPIFAHPALLGATSWSPDFGISEHILVGKLFRIAGADINAFPAPYGRFTHRRDQFIKLYAMSKAPMAHIRPCFSQTGGGLNPINIQPVIADVGRDIMLVMGGSVQAHPMGLASGIRAMRQSIDACMDGIPLAEAARLHPELGAAWELWGKGAA